ncbi:TAXI family TRAP transporter solute-binding subunit [Roseibium salinum]|uniref:TAXI family TRAP transporter solute-binding subunit n=1 Tax=Roseibium salinum TaxID=1604349 RepID=A0ABT3QVF2_9HYPH|nr:TAXI family TRAP transporter solute-binding subunit [Roseibium sp. DSM 29163]MCX2720897.1 TAXI family TRAP transporter solute-binding subunit [Roseibium sp. DSM 29163]
MKTLTKLVVTAVLALGATLPAQGVSAQSELRIGTASLGGAYYPMGQALANSINNFAEGYTMLPIVTGGGAENPRLIASGEVDVAIAPASLAFFAHEGRTPYPEALPISGLGILHSSVLHMVTLPGSGIKSVTDLRGRTVAVGPAGGGTLNILNDLLSMYDMTMEDITPSFLSYADGFSQLADGSVDASFALAGFPTSAVVQAAATNDLEFIELSDENMAELKARFPYYGGVVVPADVYGTDAPVSVISSANLLIAPADMDEDLAFTLTQAVYDHMDALIAENALAASIEPEASLDLPIPLHPGAARYFANRK